MICRKGCGRKQSLRVLKYYSSIYLECLEMHRTSIKDREWSPGIHLNSEHPEYQSRVPAAKEDDWNKTRELWIDADGEITIINTIIRRRPNILNVPGQIMWHRAHTPAKKIEKFGTNGNFLISAMTPIILSEDSRGLLQFHSATVEL
jgi:hypothetical protein